MKAGWIIPFIIIGAALQSCGAAMNGQLNKSLHLEPFRYPSDDPHDQTTREVSHNLYVTKLEMLWSFSLSFVTTEQ